METKIQLRPLELSDIDEEYCSWYKNNDGHLNYFSGSRELILGREQLILNYEEGLKTGYWHYYIIESVGQEKIGNIKIGPICSKNKTSDLVCLIGNRSFVGRGLASQAITMANKLAFEKYDIRRLHGGMYESNISSIKAYLKAGWVIEATLKGFYWLNGVTEDRVCVACFNPDYFSENK